MRVIFLSSCLGFVLDGGVLGPKLLMLLPSAGEGKTIGWSPLVFLIPRVINHMRLGREKGTLIISFCQSANWWPLVSRSPGVFQPFVLDWREILLHEFTFFPGSAAADFFQYFFQYFFSVFFFSIP